MKWLFAVMVLCGCAGPECPTAWTFALQPGEATGPLMRPGDNCLRCHSAGASAASKPFSFGGTIFPSATAGLCEGVSGVTVRATDADGQRVTVVSNEVGNFWSTVPLKRPLTLEAERAGRIVTMPVVAPSGGCALCHSWPNPVSGAAGRIRAP
jgi:hypothetical protein